MSLSPHHRGNVCKPNMDGLEELGSEHSGEVFYASGAARMEQASGGAAGRTDPAFDPQNSAVFKPDKSYQLWGHFQQAGVMKWAPQEPLQSSAWFPALPNSTKLPQNFGASLGGMEDGRGHQALPKTNHDLDSMQGEKMPTAGSSLSYSEPQQAPLEWESPAVATMHHYQGHKVGEAQYPSHTMHHAAPDTSLQPFQVAFGTNKQLQTAAFFQGFQGNNAAQNLGYSETPKSQQQQLQQLRQQQHQQQQQQRMLQMQQQYQQQKMQQQLQQMQQQQQQQQHLQNILPPEALQQNQHLLRAPAHPDSVPGNAAPCALSNPRQDPNLHPSVNKAPALALQEAAGKAEALPRRSRRLSKDGISPPAGKEAARNGGVPGTSVGVIHSTQRRRRTSKEINLETLAQKASEMEFLPAKRDESTSHRQTGIPPLVIPVSVPVGRMQVQPEQAGVWTREQTQEQTQTREQTWEQTLLPERTARSDHKPSVIVKRRRSLRTCDTFKQEDTVEDESSPDKIKRRPRPEPLVIPPPKPATFIAPSVYSSISPFQSHLRSPIRMLDNTLPPYTPPPILSPVREGSGLYFSTFLSSIAAGNQGLPPPPTPKTSRSLLRSSSSDITPPMLPLFGEATPVSLEPRINIGPQHQAEIPDVRERSLLDGDQHNAALVYLPLPQGDSSSSRGETVEDLMNLACSSVLCGGGTNVELMHHCLHESHGDVMKTLELLLLRKPLFSEDHHLYNYHYAGSDCWTVDEKRYFNKGISAYRKDFLLVQKVVQSKTLAQCVEFYYTYKKQVKVGRSGILIYGPPDPDERIPEIPQIKAEQPEAGEESKRRPENRDAAADHLPQIKKNIQVSGNDGNVLVLSNPKVVLVDNVMALRQETRAPPAVRRNTPSNVPKTQGEPEGIFPCKKCSRVFYKVKSRSAHMKSHAEQEKKAAAAQRQREEAERQREEAERQREEAERQREEAERLAAMARVEVMEDDVQDDDDWQ